MKNDRVSPPSLMNVSSLLPHHFNYSSARSSSPPAQRRDGLLNNGEDVWLWRCPVGVFPEGPKPEGEQRGAFHRQAAEFADKTLDALWNALNKWHNWLQKLSFFFTFLVGFSWRTLSLLQICCWRLIEVSAVPFEIITASPLFGLMGTGGGFVQPLNLSAYLFNSWANTHSLSALGLIF